MKKILLGHFSFTLSFLIVFTGLVSSCYLLMFSYFLTLHPIIWLICCTILSFLGAIVVIGELMIELFFFIKNREELTENDLNSGKRRIKRAVLFFLIIIIGSTVFSSISMYKENQYKEELKEECLGITKEELWTRISNEHRSSVTAYDYPENLEEPRTKNFPGKNDEKMSEIFRLAKRWEWTHSQPVHNFRIIFTFIFNEKGEAVDVELKLSPSGI